MNKPKILLYDVETAANIGAIWQKYEQNVLWYEKEWYMLCFAYKWLDQKGTKAVALPDFKWYEKNKENDKKVLEALWKLFDEADIVIAHNGNNFDQKKSNARFIFHGMTPPSPYKTIDTLKVARRYFKFNSNKLDDLGELLGLGRKLETGGLPLWKGCMEGDEKAWKKMIRYNKQDVVLLEEVYLKLLPWMTNHPNLNKYLQTEHSCPNCSSFDLQRRGKESTVGNVNLYQRWQCKSCGKWSRSRVADKDIIKPSIV